MIFDIGGRGNGKTTRLLDVLRQDPNAMLLAPTEQQALRLRAVSGFTERRIVSVLDIQLDRLRGWDLRNAHWVIDDLDDVLSRVVGGPVTRVAATGQVELHPRGDH